MSCGSDPQSRVSKTQQNVRAQKIVLIALGVFFCQGSVVLFMTGFDLMNPGQIKTHIPWVCLAFCWLGPVRAGSVRPGGLSSCCWGPVQAGSVQPPPVERGGGSPLLLGSGAGRFSPTPSLGVFSALLLGPVRACSVRSPLLGLFCVLLLGSDSAWLSQTPSAGGGGCGLV
jgi:hypothetical protein